MIALTTIVAFVHIAGALALLTSMNIITKEAEARDTRPRAKQWAFARRLIYASQSVALFCLGMYRLDGHDQLTLAQAVPQIILVVSIVIFPMLRVFGLISQDNWRRR